MTGQTPGPDPRGGGDRARTDAFRYAAGRSGLLAFVSIGVLGAIGIAVVLLDLGNARAQPGAALMVPAGGFLILAMIGLLWLARRAPVLLTVGPEGVDLPASLVRPVAWAAIWRIRCVRRRVPLCPLFVMLRLEFSAGNGPRYKRRPWTWARVDTWIARRYGLRVPVHNLDAAEAVILASVERFKPVQRVTT